MSSRDAPDWWRPVGGQNSQDSILERRSLVWNDDGILDDAVPDDDYTEEILKGKFFTRGCRGMIEELQIYCIRAAAGTLTLRYSPHPCIGPVGEIVITPGATWAWAATVIEEMWNYDSLFIWVHACSADVSWAYDTVEPYDGHEGVATEATWADLAIRPFIRAVYTGETPGDVPVSGIINNIPIPSVSTEFSYELVEIQANVLTPIVDVYGAGHCDFIRAVVSAIAGSHNTRIFVICDEVTAMNEAYNMLSGWGYTPDTPTIGLPLYAVDGMCVLHIHKRFEFRRHLRISAFNAAAAPVVSIYTFPTLMR